MAWVQQRPCGWFADQNNGSCSTFRVDYSPSLRSAVHYLVNLLRVCTIHTRRTSRQIHVLCAPLHASSEATSR
uniref:Uncharacterized protein n=1 Tax=Hyaloperonospora arabidopsidis (strain Emoy2) TaxID=559515 RepID=M4BNX2_HYAAE